MGVVAEPDDELVDEAEEEEEVVVDEADELVDLWDCQNEWTIFKLAGRSNRKAKKEKPLTRRQSGWHHQIQGRQW